MSRSADAAVGMMDTAYFVGRQQLLSFFNDLLDLHLAKIEQTASGAVACQLTEYIFPGSIPMSRVNWEAKSDYEFVANYKLLQAAFTKHHVQRHVDVDKLIRAKYQDNLEFCQWLKAFYDQSGAFRADYDAMAVREKGKGGKRYNDTNSKGPVKQSTVRSKPTSGGRTPVTSPTKSSPRAVRVQPEATVRPQRPASTKSSSTNHKTPLTASENKARPTSSTSISQTDSQILKRNAEMESRVKELEGTIAEIEKERDFYFGKLRNVELMLQVRQDKGWEGCDLEGVVDGIFKVLYATADEDIAVDEEGEVVPVTSEKIDIMSNELSDTLGGDNVLTHEIVFGPEQDE